MRDSRWPLRLFLLAAGSWFACSSGLWAADHQRKFLEGLRERGYFDTAVDYLDGLAADPACPADLKEEIDYQAGTTWILAAAQTRVSLTREQYLSRAMDRLKKFVQEHPQHPLVGDANAQLAQVLVERAKTSLASAEGRPEAEVARLREQARAAIQEAQKAFAVFLDAARKRAESFQGRVIDSNSREGREREAAYRDYLRARLYSVGAQYQLAQTYPPGDETRNKLLQETADEYGKIYEKYADYGAGLVARLQQGVCLQELGKDKEASTIFEETLTLPADDPATQPLRTEALARLCEILRKQRNHQAVVTRAQEWLEETRPNVRNGEIGLRLQFLAGMSAADLAATAEKNKDARLAQQLRATARRFLETASRLPNPNRGEAQAALADLTGEAPAEGPVQGFADAVERGDMAWDRFLAAMGQLQQDPNAVQARQDANAARDAAIGLYRAALRYASSDEMDQMNAIRFKLVYLLWDADRLEECAVLGEFLTRRYPQAAGSNKAGEVAVKAVRKLFLDSRKQGGDGEWELQSMSRLAEYLVQRWPDQNEAAEAVLSLMDSAIDLGRMDDAKAYIAKLPENSWGRGRAELRLGQALWADYVKSAAEANSVAAEQLTALRDDARDHLERGLAIVRTAVSGGQAVDYFVEYSVLLLAQAHLTMGEPNKTIALLSDEAIGPLTLIDRRNPAVSRQTFQEEVLKLALRAYVVAQQVDEAMKYLDRLESLVTEGDASTAGKNLTAVYVSLGRQLEQQLQQLRSENKTEQLETVLSGFTALLGRISQRAQGADFRSLNWVAETYFSLGKGLDPGGPEVPEKAKTFYTQALANYVTLVKRSEQEPGFAPEDAPIFLRVRLAGVLRGLRIYDKAMEAVIYVIDKLGKENRIDVQIEAASIYQEWAEQPGKEDYYLNAIRGGYEKGGRYLIWGWGGIAKRVAASYQKFESTFHQARYNLALCRLKLAQKRTGEERTRLLDEALLDIRRTYLLYPSLGGKSWYDKYDKLVRTIQQLQGERSPQGLRAFDQRSRDQAGTARS